MLPTGIREPLRKLFRSGATSAATAASITDNSGGTATQAVADVGAAFSQSGLNNIHASILDDLNKLITDVAALRTAVDNLTA
jgi:hypothetical protein